MADKDTITKDYMQDNATFADAFNFLIYGGEQVIDPQQLRPLDTITKERSVLICVKQSKESGKMQEKKAFLPHLFLW